MGLLRDIAKRLPGYEQARRWKRARDLRRWEPEDEARHRFYAGLMSAGDLVFDVGANLGNRSKVFRKIGARVVAVEPQSVCAAVLREAYGGDSDFTLVQAALGEAPGTAEIRIPEESTIASMSDDWIEAVQNSGRFGEFHWDRTETVEVTTLDALIREHGVPRFVKVDVEGFEEQVVRGLTQPVGSLSLEFTPERLDATMRALRHLNGIGPARFNFAMGEKLEFVLPDWLPLAVLEREMGARQLGVQDFGDVYARFD